MNVILKVIVGLLLFAGLTKACELEYTSAIVDSIPVEIRDRIIDDNPECIDIDVLAEYWKTKGDSVVAEIEAEQRYEREMGIYTSEY